MKNKKHLQVLLMAGLMLSHIFAFALSGGSVMGQVTDPDTKEPIASATVIFDCQGNQLVFSTNENGYYYASNIPAGTYKVTYMFMNNKVTVPDYVVGNEQTKQLDVSLPMSVTGSAIEVAADRSPVSLINPLDPQIHILDRNTIKDLPITTVDQIAAIEPGITEVDGQYFVKGSRQGSLSYYIDGCKIMGSPNIPLCGLQTFRTMTGYVPARYGDSTGGVVVIDTRSYFTE